MVELDLLDRALGAYLGLAVGDALGAPMEFLSAAEVAGHHGVHREMAGGGWLKLRPGQVTDDTEMNLAIGRPLVARGEWSIRHVAEELVEWMRGRPIDIGNTVRRGLRRYLQHGTLSSRIPVGEGGNGAAVRNLPVVLASLGDETAMHQRTLEQCHLTHNHPLSDAASVALADISQSLLLGSALTTVRLRVERLAHEHPEFSPARWDGECRPYIVDTLNTVLDAFLTTDSFEACLTKAVNRGGAADTAGAIAGQLAGARYGVQGIPPRWIRHLDHPVMAAIRSQVVDLIALSPFVRLHPQKPRVAEGAGVFRRRWP